MAPSRPPISGHRRSSLGKGAAFDAFYTTSYVAPPPVKRSASDTFLYDRGREAHHRARQEERRRIREELEHERKERLSTCQLYCLTLCMVGVQFTWTVELAYGTPYLLSLGLPKEMTALVWLAGPLSGLLIQPLIGAFSDRCTLALGKRRPFIIVGAIFVCLSMLCIAYAKDIAVWMIHLVNDTSTPERLAEQERRSAIVVAVTAFYTLDFSLNAVQASCRALILDIPPLLQQQEANAWAARLSNVAMVVGYFTGFIDLVKVFPFFGDTQIKVFCLIAIAVLLVTICVTCVTTREEQNTEEYDDSPWYYMFSYIWKALRSLPSPIQRLCNVQFFAWLGWFPFLFYSTTWVSDLYFATHSQKHPDSWAKGTRAGSFALLLYAIISVISGTILPWLISHKPCNCWLFTMKNVYTAGNLIFSLAMLSTIMVTSVTTATIIVAVIGIPWSVVLWIPFALVGEYVTVSADILHEEEEEEEREGEEERSHHHETNPLVEEGRTAGISNYGATTAAADTDIRTQSVTEDQHESTTPAAGDEEELDAGMVLGVHNMYIVFPQFAVAVVASMIFRIVEWVENGHEEERFKDGQSANVAWVLLFGGFMSLIATVLSRRIIQVPETATSKSTLQSLIIQENADRMSV